MKKQIRSVAIWQTTKALTLWYFIIAVIVFVILTIVELTRGVGAKALANLIAPFVYAAMLLCFHPIALWIYNKVAGWVGGIEFTLTDKE